MKEEISILMQYIISCIKVFKSPDDGSQIGPKRVAANKTIKLMLCVSDIIHILGDLTQVVHRTDQWQTFVNKVIYLRVV